MAPFSRIFQLVAAACAAMAGAASARPIDADWPEVARASQGDCELVVTGNGRFFRIAASGLGAGERAQFYLTNGTMTPIDWQVRAGSAGAFARHYLPWRENHGDSVVAVSLTSAGCNVTAAFPFETARPVVH